MHLQGARPAGPAAEDPGEWMLDHLYNLPEELDEERAKNWPSRAGKWMPPPRKPAAAGATGGNPRATGTSGTASPPVRRPRRPHLPHQSPHRKFQRPNCANGLTNSKSALKERHTERNALRRELNEVLKETAELRELKTRPGPDANAAGEPDREEQALAGRGDDGAATRARAGFSRAVFCRRWNRFPGMCPAASWR